MKKFTVKPILFMIILSIVFTGALATINEITKERVQLNLELKEQNSLLYVINIPVESNNPVEINRLYDNSISIVEYEGVTLYEGRLNDEIVGYALPVIGDAVWGELKGFIGLSPDFNEIIGLDFLSHSETPGLGGRIDELDFKEQFRNIKIVDSENGEYIIYHPNPEGQVDAISGATGTSNAVRRILNNNLKDFFTEIKGVQ